MTSLFETVLSEQDRGLVGEYGLMHFGLPVAQQAHIRLEERIGVADLPTAAVKELIRLYASEINSERQAVALKLLDFECHRVGRKPNGFVHHLILVAALEHWGSISAAATRLGSPATPNTIRRAKSKAMTTASDFLRLVDAADQDAGAYLADRVISMRKTLAATETRLATARREQTNAAAHPSVRRFYRLNPRRAL